MNRAFVPFSCHDFEHITGVSKLSLLTDIFRRVRHFTVR